MEQVTLVARPDGQRLGEGGFPPALDRANFGALLLAFLWAPIHRLWGWFAVFLVLEGLESALALSAPGAFGGVLEQPVVTVGFRIVYWTVTVAFALQANRLAWAAACRRAARANGGPVPRTSALVSRYASNQRVWAIAGLVLLAAAPLTLLIGSVGSIPGAAADVAATLATQAVLLVALFVYDRVRTARRQARS